MTVQAGKLTRKQEQAVAALLTGPTIHDAAQQAGIAEATLHRWLKQDTFQQAYASARREVVRQAVAHLQRACGTAVATLQTIMGDTDASASARVAACRTVLDQTLKAIELEDLERRLEALEHHVGGPR